MRRVYPVLILVLLTSCAGGTGSTETHTTEPARQTSTPKASSTTHTPAGPFITTADLPDGWTDDGTSPEVLEAVVACVKLHRLDDVASSPPLATRDGGQYRSIVTQVGTAATPAAARKIVSAGRSAAGCFVGVGSTLSGQTGTVKGTPVLSPVRTSLAESESVAWQVKVTRDEKGWVLDQFYTFVLVASGPKVGLVFAYGEGTAFPSAVLAPALPVFKARLT
jgi:hypothetical protein